MVVGATNGYDLNKHESSVIHKKGSDLRGPLSIQKLDILDPTCFRKCKRSLIALQSCLDHLKNMIVPYDLQMQTKIILLSFKSNPYKDKNLFSNTFVQVQLQNS